MPSPMAKGAQPDPGKRSLDKGGRRNRDQDGNSARPEELVSHRPESSRQNRQAMSRTLAQPLESEHKEGEVVRGGRHCDHGGSSNVILNELTLKTGQPMGHHRKVLARQNGQRHKEPLELDDKAEDQTVHSERGLAEQDQRADQEQDHARAEHSQPRKEHHQCCHREQVALQLKAQEARELQDARKEAGFGGR